MKTRSSAFFFPLGSGASALISSWAGEVDHKARVMSFVHCTALHCISEILIRMGLSFARLLKLNQFGVNAMLQVIGIIHE